jgi:uncharacterized protein YegP (UPF0339 family)
MGKYVIRKTAGGYKFDLKASNGETVATSEGYTSRALCLAGIRSVRKNGVTEKLEDQSIPTAFLTNPKFELYRDRGGKYRFRLRARNGQIIASSEAYSTHGACLGGIESVRQNAPSEDIEEINGEAE